LTIAPEYNWPLGGETVRRAALGVRVRELVERGAAVRVRGVDRPVRVVAVVETEVPELVGALTLRQGDVAVADERSVRAAGSYGCGVTPGVAPVLPPAGAF
jgi:hypothetical protein